MTSGLRLDPKDAVPLWKQLELGLRRLVASGQLARASAVPSVREMAQALQVNPATVVRAYNSLIEQKIFAAVPGLGTFVAEDVPEPDDVREALDTAADRFAEVAASLGAGADEAVASVRSALRRIRPRKGEKS
jgi:GntR family transcriptional regulator